MSFTEPEVVAGVARDALQAEPLVVRVFLAQERVKRQDAGTFRLGQQTLTPARRIVNREISLQQFARRLQPSLDFRPDLDSIPLLH